MPAASPEHQCLGQPFLHTAPVIMLVFANLVHCSAMLSSHCGNEIWADHYELAPAVPLLLGALLHFSLFAHTDFSLACHTENSVTSHNVQPQLGFLRTQQILLLGMLSG